MSVQALRVIVAKQMSVGFSTKKSCNGTQLCLYDRIIIKVSRQVGLSAYRVIIIQFSCTFTPSKTRFCSISPTVNGTKVHGWPAVRRQGKIAQEKVQAIRSKFVLCPNSK
jgi:hypothetical protein